VAYKRIVVATDVSASAETAEHVAATLAAAVKARLTIAHAYVNPARADEAVERAIRLAEGEGSKVEVALSAEEPADAVIAAAAERDADLIVIERWLRPSAPVRQRLTQVATHAPRRAAHPVPPQASSHGNPPYRHLLIATDGSVTADRAACKVRAGQAWGPRDPAFVGHRRPVNSS
jgi:nucleotide-binding universal stress UspA family protein